MSARPEALAPAPLPLRPLLLRHLGFLAALCTAIALLLTAIDGGGLRYKLVYSFSIGLCCWTMTDLFRVALIRWINRRRQRRGETAAAPFSIGWKGMLPMLALATILGPPLGLAIADAITGLQSTSLLRWESPAARMTIALSVFGSAAAMFAMTVLERLAQSRADAEAARRLAAENQLKLLQSQLEPHMLFNTLANLRVLIGIDSGQAQAMLDRLIAFLRATLNASRTASHPLQAEFDRIADYLALMALRMGPRLTVRLELPPELRTLPMPPLLLQPLVENSIRHGLEPKVAPGRIDVTARREGAMLELVVRDTGVGLATTGGALEGTRFGLEQVRARLAATYGAAAQLELKPAGDAEGGTIARITWPLS